MKYIKTFEAYVNELELPLKGEDENTKADKDVAAGEEEDVVKADAKADAKGAEEEAEEEEIDSDEEDDDDDDSGDNDDNE